MGAQLLSCQQHRTRLCFHISQQKQKAADLFGFIIKPLEIVVSLYFFALLPMATSLGSGGLLGMTSEEQ